ncbi:MAG: pseudouridine synthase [Lachnospiraceae bacterium]|nr:pseudouridine synthase [Lachnospiraceae bacterium]
MADISGQDYGIRINKFLSEAGICSRREADKMLLNGRVCIDGALAAAGAKVFPGMEVTVDGRTVSKEEEEIFIAFYKPKGVVCTTAPEENGTKIVNVIDYIGYNKRIYPAGRLDQSSEGLLLLTNQGEVMEKILRSRYGHEKEYFVRTDKRITDSFIDKMGKGVPVLGTVTKPCKVWKEDNYSFHIILTQGLNRQIRRMCGYFGYKVVYLRRDRVMNITLDGLKKGQYRLLDKEEAAVLKRLAGQI